MTHHDPVRFIPGLQKWFNTQKVINVIYHINKMKGEKTTCTSQCRKNIDKIRHPFKIKMFSKKQLKETTSTR